MGNSLVKNVLVVIAVECVDATTRRFRVSDDWSKSGFCVTIRICSAGIFAKK